MTDDIKARINERYSADAKPVAPVRLNREQRRSRPGRRRYRERGVSLVTKPWHALSHPQVYDIDKRGRVHGKA